MPQALQQLRRGLLREAGGDRVLAQVLAIVPVAGLDAVLVAAELAMEHSPPSGRVSVERIVNVLGRLYADRLVIAAPGQIVCEHQRLIKRTCHTMGSGGSR